MCAMTFLGHSPNGVPVSDARRGVPSRPPHRFVPTDNNQEETALLPTVLHAHDHQLRPTSLCPADCRSQKSLIQMTTASPQANIWQPSPVLRDPYQLDLFAFD